MFTVKKVTTVECYCPHGHTPLTNLLPQEQHSPPFCHICGLPIEQRQVTYDAAYYCADCNNPVHPSWNYCPYCSQGRE